MDDDGVLVGNISVNDLKVDLFFLVDLQLIGPELDHLHLLAMSVEEYLNSHSHPDTRELSLDVRFKPLRDALKRMQRPVVECSLNDSLAYVIHLVRTFSIHRVFVVNELCKPVGVISLVELLQALFSLRQTIPLSE